MVPLLCYIAAIDSATGAIEPQKPGKNRIKNHKAADHFIIEPRAENCSLLLSFSALIFIEVLIKFKL